IAGVAKEGLGEDFVVVLLSGYNAAGRGQHLSFQMSRWGPRTAVGESGREGNLLPKGGVEGNARSSNYNTTSGSVWPIFSGSGERRRTGKALLRKVDQLVGLEVLEYSSHFVVVTDLSPQTEKKLLKKSCSTWK